MRPNVMGSIFWTVQFVNFCIVASRTLGSYDSCPCVPSTGCPDDFQLSIDNQVLILPCESRNLVRCCSTKPRSIESARASELPRNSESTLLKINEAEAGTTELNISMHIKENIEGDVTTESHGTEDLDNNVAAETSESKSMDSTDVNRVPLQHPRTELPPKPRLAIAKAQNEEIPNSPRTVSFTASKDRQVKNGRLATPIQPFQPDEDESDILDFIREVKFFESRRTVPKQPDLLQNIPRRINSAPSKAVILNKGYFNMNVRVLSTAKRLSEKMSDLAKQKTLLEAALTPDRVSAQATNENASSVSELDVAQRDDTSIRNLPHPEDTDDVKRVARSHASEPNEEPEEDRRSKSLSPRAKTGNQVEAETVPVKPFKRPPRILPVRHLSKEETDSTKFTSSRERAISLFNKSNESRRKQVSLLANRNDSNFSKINSSKSSSSTTEQTETETLIETESSTDGSVNLLIEENVHRSSDAVREDVEKKVNKDV
ncbi:uncharacterized protein LOC143213419 [Lasioglossum baleicum]|uniref:uncharacterized protein LOC143213419 n=1 Tax=Lasioglossum baleicum TaxID=434251 RepID=UPI003FCCA6B7